MKKKILAKKIVNIRKTKLFAYLSNFDFSILNSPKSLLEKGVYVNLEAKNPYDDLLESSGAIILRPSLLDLGVRFSPHLAPENLSLSDFCSCEYNDDNFYGRLLDS